MKQALRASWRWILLCVSIIVAVVIVSQTVDRYVALSEHATSCDTQTKVYVAQLQAGQRAIKPLGC